MTDIAEIAASYPGPCVICGRINYELSMGGPTICPSCDCGDFGIKKVQRQGREIGELRAALATSQVRVEELERWKGVVSEYAANCLDEPDDKKQMQSAMGVIGFIIIMQRERATAAEAEIARLREAAQGVCKMFSFGPLDSAATYGPDFDLGSAQNSALARLAATSAEPVACEHRWEPRTSRVMGVKTWQCDKCGEFGGSP